MHANESVISLEQVERTFITRGREVHALRGIDMQVQRGAFVVMMGPSGSGKTTLLNLVGGLDQPTAGVVTVEGRRLDQMSGAALAAMRRQIGFIFQSFALMPTASAYENVELGLRLSGGVPRKEWDARVRRCLGAVGLAAWMDHRPYEMSGGQQQRVAIARALAIRPRIILADEPTGALDTRTGVEIMGIFQRLNREQGMTVILVTHDPEVARYAERVISVRDGQLAGDDQVTERIDLVDDEQQALAA